MPKYIVGATREVYYEFEIEAEDEGAVYLEVNRIELEEDVEKYAYDWMPLEVNDIEEEEE